ncbi:Maf-like protein-domain-containing protein [Kalaharituber pfeilii]|nr:Maf-like protein-domain-containing protein [Kalaharituber pfeilii]
MQKNTWLKGPPPANGMIKDLRFDCRERLSSIEQQLLTPATQNSHPYQSSSQLNCKNLTTLPLVSIALLKPFTSIIRPPAHTPTSPDDVRPDSIPTDPPPAYDGPPAAPLPRPLPPRLPLSLPALNHLRTRRIILASASPRRSQLLSLLGLPNLEIIPSTFPETLSKTEHTPFSYVSSTAHEKCREVYARELDSHPDGKEVGIVIAADTVIVDNEGRVIEKPRSREDHLSILKGLRNGGGHKVFTAVVCMAPRDDLTHPGYNVVSHVEETLVKFDSLVTDELIEAYVRTREGIDKAGGYAIQGLGAILIEKIEGSYDNVVGLPLRATLRLIEKVVSGETDAEEEFGSDEE